jgi:hypothetical protein
VVVVVVLVVVVEWEEEEENDDDDDDDERMKMAKVETLVAMSIQQWNFYHNLDASECTLQSYFLSYLVET